MSNGSLTQEDIAKLVLSLTPGFAAAVQAIVGGAAAGLASRAPGAAAQGEIVEKDDLSAAFEDMSLNRTKRSGAIQSRFQDFGFTLDRPALKDRTGKEHFYTLAKKNGQNIALLHLPSEILTNTKYYPHLSLVIDPISNTIGRILSEENDKCKGGYLNMFLSYSKPIGSSWEFIPWSTVSEWLDPNGDLMFEACFHLPLTNGNPSGSTGNSAPAIIPLNSKPALDSSVRPVPPANGGRDPEKPIGAANSREAEMLLGKPKNELIDIIANQARNMGGGQIVYFENLIRKLPIAPTVQQEKIESLEKNAETNAGRLVDWALNYGASRDERIPMISSIVQHLYERTGFEEASFLASLTVAYRLAEPAEIADVTNRYQLPQPPERVTGPVIFGPAIRPIGGSKELQGFLQKEPDFLDVWLLKQAVERARSVCLVVVPQIDKKGTGVLIDKNLVLTNFHVLSQNKTADLETLKKNAAGAFLRFGAYRSQGAAAEGQQVGLDQSNPVISFSPENRHDFVLLRVDDAIGKLTDVTSTPFVTRVPANGTSLNILQHPEGGAMKLALSSNGVSGTDPEAGLLQYVTRTRDGSSGSPCFDADWNMIALHHSQEAWTFGTFREGTLMVSIYEQIKGNLSAKPT